MESEGVGRGGPICRPTGGPTKSRSSVARHDIAHTHTPSQLARMHNIHSEAFIANTSTPPSSPTVATIITIPAPPPPARPSRGAATPHQSHTTSTRASSSVRMCYHHRWGLTWLAFVCMFVCMCRAMAVTSVGFVLKRKERSACCPVGSWVLLSRSSCCGSSDGRLID